MNINAFIEILGKPLFPPKESNRTEINYSKSKFNSIERKQYVSIIENNKISSHKQIRFHYENVYLSGTIVHFQCKKGYCYPAYGNPINGNSEDVAGACSMDKGCKAYQYSSDNGYGHLCSAITDAGLWGDYLNCIKM